MGLTPIPMMDRARKHELPQSQVGVPSGVGTLGYPHSRNFRGGYIISKLTKGSPLL